MVDIKKTALVIGATGVVGRNLLHELLNDPRWDVIAVSRRKPEASKPFRHIAVDLLDPTACQRQLGELEAVTHVFYSAYVERPTWSEMVPPNLAMLVNTLDALEPVAKNLRHVHVMHGTKWYGNHLGAFKTPAKESDPRHMPPNFYYDQLDFLASRQRGKSWSWSAARPHGICGFAIGNPMNLVMVLAVYATISKALGLPLRHPGSQANADALYNVTDSGLLSRASLWMSTVEGAENQSFNVTNGDCFRWRDMWPAIADYFQMETAQAQKIDLVDMMADKAPVWSQLVQAHGLRDIPFEQLVGWKYGNFVFAPEYDVLSSSSKIKAHGFHEVQDSEVMFLRQFDELRAQRIIP